jgi:hypothetical protein
MGALAIGGGLLAVIMAYESRRASRASSPAIMRGRWASHVSYHRIGSNPFQDIADATEEFAAIVADAIDSSGIQFGSDGERSALIDRVMRAAFNQAKADV